MKLVDLTWSTYRIPFCNPFRTAHGAFSHRCGAIVTIYIDDGYAGNGEIAPLPEHSGTSLNRALNALPGLARELQGRDLVDVLHVLEARSQDGRLPAAVVGGLETALLDALGQARGQSIATLLASGYPGGENQAPALPRSAIPVNAVIDGRSIEKTVQSARAASSAGFSCLKLKLTGASQAEIERVAAIRAAIGPAIRLRLDANEGWNIEQAQFMLARCAAYDIQYIEQPLPARDLRGLAHLRRTSPIPLAADEALSGLESAQRILNAEAADVLVLKPQLAGGLHTCRQIISLASQHNVACVITSTLESGLGVAAALHLAAASPEVLLACGLATLALLESTLLQEEMPMGQGMLQVPPGPGLGVHLDPLKLRRYAR